MALHSISICSGIGGLDLGVSRVLPTRTVCYVEREVSVAEVLVSRMEDGQIDPAPIYSDLGYFDGKPWRGKVDLITAGLPCQPFSVAGRQQGEDDERYIWPEFFRIVREVSPSLVFLENVPNILRWFRPIGEQLSGLGYELEAGLFTASEVGASHKRQRFFCLGIAKGHDQWREWGHEGRREGSTGRSAGVHVAHGIGSGLEERGREPADLGRQCEAVERSQPALADSGCQHSDLLQRQIRGEPSRESGSVGDASRQPSNWCRDTGTVRRGEPTDPSGPVEHARSPQPHVRGSGHPAQSIEEVRGFPPGPSDHQAWSDLLVREPHLRPALSQAEAESMVRGEDDGVPFGLDRTARLRALGNAVVPAQAEYALRTLINQMRV